MKPDTKRYMLASYAGCIDRTCSSKEEYDLLLDSINYYNNHVKDKNGNKTKFYLGNVTYTIDEENIYHVKINKYRKLLSKKMTIKEIDYITFNYNSIYELIDDITKGDKDKIGLLSVDKSNKDKSRVKIGVMYFEDENKGEKTDNSLDRRIKDIPVLYRYDAKYLSKEYLFKCMEYYLNKGDYDFFLKLASSFERSKNIEEYIEKLRITIDKVEHQNLDPNLILNVVDRLYNSYIVKRNNKGAVERDEEGKEITDHRRMRDMIFFVRDYNMVKRNRHLPLERFDKINHKLNKEYNKELMEQEERIQDSIEEERALDAWDNNFPYIRKK